MNTISYLIYKKTTLLLKNPKLSNDLIDRERQVRSNNSGWIRPLGPQNIRMKKKSADSYGMVKQRNIIRSLYPWTRLSRKLFFSNSHLQTQEPSALTNSPWLSYAFTDSSMHVKAYVCENDERVICLQVHYQIVHLDRMFLSVNVAVTISQFPTKFHFILLLAPDRWHSRCLYLCCNNIMIFSFRIRISAKKNIAIEP